MYTAYGTKRRTGAAATILYIRARKSGGVKVTAKGEEDRGGRKLVQSYQPDELYRTVTHCCLKSRQWEATCLSSSLPPPPPSPPFVSRHFSRFFTASCCLPRPPCHFFLVPATRRGATATSKLIFYETSGEYRSSDRLVDRRTFGRQTHPRACETIGSPSNDNRTSARIL